MRNKVLIVESNPKECADIEVILQQMVAAGGELFIAHKVEDGLTILKKEKPQIVFLDASFVSDDPKKWIHKDVTIILMRYKQDPDYGFKDFIFKPLRERQILEKCREILDPEPASLQPPM